VLCWMLMWREKHPLLPPPSSILSHEEVSGNLVVRKIGLLKGWGLVYEGKKTISADEYLFPYSGVIEKETDDNKNNKYSVSLLSRDSWMVNAKEVGNEGRFVSLFFFTFVLLILFSFSFLLLLFFSSFLLFLLFFSLPSLMLFSILFFFILFFFLFSSYLLFSFFYFFSFLLFFLFFYSSVLSHSLILFPIFSFFIFPPNFFSLLLFSFVG